MRNLCWSLLLLIAACWAQTKPLFDPDSPLGNRIGYSNVETSFSEHVAKTSAEGRRVKRNSAGLRVLAEHESNNSVTLEQEVEEVDTEGGIQQRRRRLQAAAQTSLIVMELSTDVNLVYEPPNFSFSEKALGVFVRSNKPTAKLYYEFENVNSQVVPDPTLASAFLTYDSPYIHLNTPFGASRIRSVNVIAVWFDERKQYLVRSNMIELKYTVEADARPDSFGFLVPGVESSSYFIKFVIEMKAAARAQVAGGQEFADFYTELGVGTYNGQILAMRLLDLHPDLTGFEGGFSMNCTNREDHYGVLVPFHNGDKFVGKVVRVNLKTFTDPATCLANFRMETIDPITGQVVVTGPASSTDACVHVLDLTSMHKDARGFRRGFMEYPYAFLSPGEFNIPVRLDVCNFGIDTTKVLDLGTVSRKYGGYSGGFVDGIWSCFNPFRSYTGPFGGIRSTEPADQGHLRPYYHAEVLCIEHDGWEGTKSLELSLKSFDLGNVAVDLRGFSEAIRLGRFAYLSPLATQSHVYAGKVVRIFLGAVDIGETLDYLESSGGKIRDIVDLIDLKLINPMLCGFSGLFNSGKFLYLVPFRNKEELFNGQRGFGTVVRIDLNRFGLDGIKILDMETTTRSQIPSFADEDLRGFSGGFGSGKYGLLVPFYNAVFSGKVGRFIAITDDMTGNVQLLDMENDRLMPDTYKGFRGGFVSLWQGLPDVVD